MPAKKYYKKRKGRRSSRKRVQSGGASATYSFGSSPVAAGAPYAQTVIPGSACQAATKFDHIAGYVPPGRGGLPGYAGGGRRTLKKKKTSKNSYSKFSKHILKYIKFYTGTSKKSRRRQRGGAGYSVDVSQTTGGPNPFVPVAKGTCEGGPVTTAQYTAPGVLRQSGGVGGVDSAFLQMQNAGYSNEVPKWIASTGTPGGGSLIQQPYAATSMNPACIQTGAGRRKRNGSKKARRRH